MAMVATATIMTKTETSPNAMKMSSLQLFLVLKTPFKTVVAGRSSSQTQKQNHVLPNESKHVPPRSQESS